MYDGSAWALDPFLTTYPNPQACRWLAASSTPRLSCVSGAGTFSIEADLHGRPATSMARASTWSSSRQLRKSPFTSEIQKRTSISYAAMTASLCPSTPIWRQLLAEPLPRLPSQTHRLGIAGFAFVIPSASEFCRRSLQYSTALFAFATTTRTSIFGPDGSATIPAV